jgi:uncharacterized RDD family membrane protein YckC
MLDTRYAVETPEGVQLMLTTAGPVPRALAQVLDVIFRTIVYIIVLTATSRLKDLGTGIWLIFIFIMEWFYPVLFEVLWHGSTPGKSIMKLRVVYATGAPVGWRGSLLRNLLRVVDFLPVCYGYGLLSMLLDRDFRRLGDHVAGTLVVYRDTQTAPSTRYVGTPEAPPTSVNLDEQRALVAFVEREHRLSHERKLELANVLASWLNATGEQALKRTHDIGLWLMGRR